MGAEVASATGATGRYIDDPVWRWQARMAKVSATRAGVYGTPYDHHDGSASGQISRCPAR